MELEKMKAENKAAEDMRQRQTQIMVEESKYVGLLKSNIVTSTLSDPAKTINDLPAFVFEGLAMEKSY
jgi:hypothetical protein